jgi:PITH domain
MLLTKLHGQFNQPVRVRSIILHTVEPHWRKGPNLVKLLVNRNAIGFEDVEGVEEPEVAQVLEVPEDAIKEGRPIHLRFVRFQSVNSLHVSTACGYWKSG